MKTIKTFLFILVALMLVGVQAQAQTTINATTLSSAVTTPSPTVGPANTVVLASVGSGSTAVLAGMTLFIDGEAMNVTTTPTTTTVTVRRATNGTRAQTHASGSIVYYGNNQAFVSGTSGVQFYQGSCTSSQFLYLPIIDTVNATVGNCLDSRWSWTRIGAPFASSYPYHAVTTGAYTAKITDYFIAYTTLTSESTITLPAATGLIGKVFVIKNTSAISTNTVWVSGTIDGTAASVPVYGTGGVTSTSGTLNLVSNGTGWYRF